MLWKKSVSRRSKDVQVPVLRGVELVEVVDIGGYRVGVMMQSVLHQSTVVVRGDEDTTREEVDQWLVHISSVERVVVATVMTVAGVDGGVPRFMVTFDMSGLSRDEFLTLVAKRLSVLCYSPDEVEIMWHVQSVDDVAGYASSVWAPSSKVVFPPFADELVEGPRSIVCDGVARVVFEVNAHDAAGLAALEEIRRLVVSASLGVGESMYVVEVVRPTDSLYRVQYPEADRFRRSGIIVLSAESDVGLEGFAAEMIARISVRSRLRLSRLYGRQYLGVLLAAGIPVYGWQTSRVTSLVSKMVKK